MFKQLAIFFDSMGTRASALVLHGPLNSEQQRDLSAILEAVDLLKRECSSQATQILRAARAKREN